MTRPFTVDLGWAALFQHLGVRAGDLLRAARLPADLFAQPRPTLAEDEFRRLWDALAQALGTDAPGLAVGRAISVEMFSPPLFAAFCSPDLTMASQRLSQFKPLVGPLVLTANDLPGGLELIFGPEPGVTVPEEFLAAELVFLVHLARLATRTPVRPVAVELEDPPSASGYAAFFDHPVRKGPVNRVVFSPQDARRPFVSANPALFAAFEPDLRLRLDELRRTAGMSERLRAALMEALPAGQVDVGTAARRLGVSARSLQRRLAAEGTSFQAELQALRNRLANAYLARPDRTSAEIAFLLGYEDPNSFIRAFHAWTGTTPEAMRARLSA